MTQSNTSQVTWWVEFEDGGKSIVYDTEAQTRAGLPDLKSIQAQINSRYSRPVWLVSSDGQKIAISSVAA